MGSFKSKRLFVFSNLWLGPLPAPSGWHFRFSLTLTRPQKQLSIPKKKGKHSQALWYTVTSDLSDGALPMIQLELLSFLVYRPLWFPRWGHRWGLVPTWPWNLTGFIICRLSLFSLLCKSSFCKKPFRLSSPAGNLNDTRTQLLVCLLRGDKIDFIDPTQAKEKPIALNMQGRRQRSGLYNVMEKFLWVFWFLSSVFFLTFHRGGLSLLESILTEWVQAAVLWLWGKQMNSYLFELTGGESASMFTVQSQLQNCRGQHTHRLLLKRLFAVASFGCSN